MKLRKGKISILFLSIVSIITILLVILEFNSKSRVPTQYFQEKLQAAKLTQQALKTIRKAVDSLAIPIDRINDPNATGLIGLQYSAITTERGDLDAKLTSTNPNFAALIIKLIKDNRLEKGDVVAVLFTGSYPAVNIAVLSAIKILQLKPVIITSVGASMWGANYPQFTYLDMESVLNQTGLLKFKTSAASIGGEDDIGRGLSPEGREIIEAAITRNSIPLLDAANLEEAIAKKMEFYQKNDDIKLFINVAEKTTALAGSEIASGFINPRQIKLGTGIIAQFSQNGVPVINLNDIDELAKKYHLPVAPIPQPNAGEGSLYYEYRYSVTQAIISSAILFIILFVVLRYDIDFYLKRSKND